MSGGRFKALRLFRQIAQASRFFTRQELISLLVVLGIVLVGLFARLLIVDS